MRVLLVEDSVTQREALKFACQKFTRECQIEWVEVGSLAAAEQAVKVIIPDAAIVELVLDGSSTSDQVNAFVHRLKRRRIPVIVYTSNLKLADEGLHCADKGQTDAIHGMLRRACKRIRSGDPLKRSTV